MTYYDLYRYTNMFANALTALGVSKGNRVTIYLPNIPHTAIAMLGGQVRQLVPVELRGLAETRYLVVVDKVAATPEKYPRRPGVPQKRPLGY